MAWGKLCFKEQFLTVMPHYTFFVSFTRVFWMIGNCVCMCLIELQKPYIILYSRVSLICGNIKRLDYSYNNSDCIHWCGWVKKKQCHKALLPACSLRRIGFNLGFLSIAIKKDKIVFIKLEFLLSRISMLSENISENIPFCSKRREVNYKYRYFINYYIYNWII